MPNYVTVSTCRDTQWSSNYSLIDNTQHFSRFKTDVCNGKNVNYFLVFSHKKIYSPERAIAIKLLTGSRQVLLEK